MNNIGANIKRLHGRLLSCVMGADALATQNGINIDIEIPAGAGEKDVDKVNVYEVVNGSRKENTDAVKGILSKVRHIEKYGVVTVEENRIVLALKAEKKEKKPATTEKA